MYLIVSQAIHDAEAVLAHAQKKAEASKEALAQVQLLATCTFFFHTLKFSPAIFIGWNRLQEVSYFIKRQEEAK